MKRILAVMGCLAAAAVASCWGHSGYEPVALGGNGGSGGEIGGGGMGGVGGVVPDHRGDPSEFPTDCIESCADACARLAECDGDSSSVHPMTEENCLERCAMALNGPVWSDISGNFRCCVSQDECSDVQHCGGWLDHPDAANSCEQMCGCFFSSAVESLVAGRSAPEGYAFAPNVLMIEPSQASVDLDGIPGVRTTKDFSRKVIALDRSTGIHTNAALAKLGRILPTFVDGAGRISAASGRIVLIVRDPHSLPAAEAIAERHGLQLPRKTKLRLVQNGPGNIHLLDGKDGWAALDALAELDAVAGLSAELDHVRHYEARYTPDDPRFGDQWHLQNTGQEGSTVSVDGRVDEAWDVTMGDPQVIIAINDDGIDLNHPDFAGKLEPELNVPADWETMMGSGRYGGHGTSCAGVAAATGDNAEGGSGVCPLCRVLPHMLGEVTGISFQVTDVEIAEGFENQVDAGAWVISNSWGPSTGDPYVDAPSMGVPPLAAIIQAAFDYAESDGRGGLGTVILYAAGNSNDVLEPTGGYVTNITVGAVADVGIKSYYSSFGPEQDIAAPSNGGHNGITTTAIFSDYTDSFGGTSSACPFVAGVVGLMLSANPDLTAQEVRDLLGQSATKIDRVFGMYDGNDHSVYYGAGMVNAYKAVQMASGSCVDPDSCPAPSDDCGASCGTGVACDVCRTHADCAADHVCQALPTLGIMACVASTALGPCGAGTAERNGYCVPTSVQTCGLCGGDEECNGRDENCDGHIDDGVCNSGPMCWFDGPGCESGFACVGRTCLSECNDDGDCVDEDSCETLKDQYGNIPGVKACVPPGLMSQGGCQFGCELLAASLDDAALAAFVECMQDGATPCNQAFNCASMLPIEY